MGADVLAFSDAYHQTATPHRLRADLDAIVIDPQDIAQLKGEQLSAYTNELSRHQVALLKLVDIANQLLREKRLARDKAKARARFARDAKQSAGDILDAALILAEESDELLAAQHDAKRASDLLQTAKDLRIDAQSQSKNMRP